MRDDLDFLYQKAMRSSDWKFIDEVAMLLSNSNRGDESDVLFERAGNLWHLENDSIIPDFYDKFSFLISDSQMGENWYRNK